MRQHAEMKQSLMKTEFRKAVLPLEIEGLLAFDRKVFPSADRFDRAYWSKCESYWLLVGNIKVGCCAFEKHIDFHGDSGEAPHRKGSLYISTTGILPRFQKRGFGALLKSWEIAYARYHGFNRVITTCRKSNTHMIQLNRRFGFKKVRTVPYYYEKESAVLMELLLDHAN
jgi:ribosomal protein S18 acetylase RimI-like enzyme